MELKWYADLKKEDFPEGEPIFKMKRGLLWRFNDCGYTHNPLEAQMYDHAEAMRCFHGTEINGGDHNDEKTFAVPIGLYLKRNEMSTEVILKQMQTLSIFLGLVALNTPNSKKV
jgi:hypothetical protein